MEKTIDARGQVCPKPLVMARDTLKTLTKDDTLNVVVDNAISAQNLEKMAGQMELASKKVQQGSDYIVSFFVNKSSFVIPQTEELNCNVPEKVTGDTIVVINTDVMGKGDEKLGKILIKGFVYSLTCVANLPATIILYNSGVKLAVKDSPVVEDLQNLAEAGVDVCVCGTCVEYYGLKEQLAVGRIVNMLNIVETQMAAARILRP